MKVDKNRIAANYAGDEDIFADYVASYLNTFPQLLTKLESAFDNHSVSEFRVVMHTLKGILAGFYTDELVFKASQIESMDITKNRNLVRSKINELTKELETLNTELFTYLDSSEAV